MAKDTKDNDFALIDVQEAYSRTEQFMDKNRKPLLIGISSVAGVFLLILAYQGFVVRPAEAAAEAAIWRAEAYFEMDSLDLAAYGDGFSDGLETVMTEHAGTKAGQRAAYRMGVYHRSKGAWDEAIAAFSEVDFDDDVVGPLAVAGIGDCQVELQQFDEAIASFEDAVGRSENGLAADALAPMFLMKSAIVKLETGDTKGALADFSRIADDYASSQQATLAKGYAASLSAQ
jgi:TolA-binding protein